MATFLDRLKFWLETTVDADYDLEPFWDHFVDEELAKIAQYNDGRPAYEELERDYKTMQTELNSEIDRLKRQRNTAQLNEATLRDVGTQAYNALDDIRNPLYGQEYELAEAIEALFKRIDEKQKDIDKAIEIYKEKSDQLHGQAEYCADLDRRLNGATIRYEELCKQVSLTPRGKAAIEQVEENYPALAFDGFIGTIFEKAEKYDTAADTNQYLRTRLNIAHDQVTQAENLIKRKQEAIDIKQSELDAQDESLLQAVNNLNLPYRGRDTVDVFQDEIESLRKMLHAAWEKGNAQDDEIEALQKAHQSSESALISINSEQQNTIGELERQLRDREDRLQLSNGSSDTWRENSRALEEKNYYLQIRMNLAQQKYHHVLNDINNIVEGYDADATHVASMVNNIRSVVNSAVDSDRPTYIFNSDVNEQLLAALEVIRDLFNISYVDNFMNAKDDELGHPDFNLRSARDLLNSIYNVAVKAINAADENNDDGRE